MALRQVAFYAIIFLVLGWCGADKIFAQDSRRDLGVDVPSGFLMGITYLSAQARCVTSCPAVI